MRSRHVPARGRHWFRVVGWLALALMLQHPVLALAQTAVDPDYRLRPGDEILLGVPGRPELEQNLTLDAAGRVTLAQVGEVGLSGLTIDEAAEVLRQRLRLFYPNLDEVEVELQTASQVRLHVIGQVPNAGEYQFTVVPSLWTLLRMAGGPGEGADPARARIVRVVDGRTTVLPVDLTTVMERGGDAGIELQAGDTLVVPPMRDDAPLVPAASGVQVFGAVIEPTVVEISQPTELMHVLMLAGAPTTESNLSKVYWVHRLERGFAATEVDVRRFLEDGDEVGNPLVHPGDTVEVRESRPSWFSTALPLILGTIATAATVALAVDRLTSE